MTVDHLLAEARGVIRHRPGPAEALAAQTASALQVDIRGDDQRQVGGLVPGALVLPRKSLEWRSDPASQCRHPEINDWTRPLILICNEGLQSSLGPRPPCPGSAKSMPPTRTGLCRVGCGNLRPMARTRPRKRL